MMKYASISREINTKSGQVWQTFQLYAKKYNSNMNMKKCQITSLDLQW